MAGGSVMSFKVLVIPEDPTNNGYILQPLLKAILAEAGKPQAKIDVLKNPHLKGYDQAVTAIKTPSILEQKYKFWNLWIFMPDRDRASEGAMRELERDLATRQVNLLCCPAEPEVEIYACVAYRRDLDAAWEKVRVSKRMKEDHFDPLLMKHGDKQGAGEGRKLMIQESLKSMRTLYQLCPELDDLRQRVTKLITS